MIVLHKLEFVEIMMILLRRFVEDGPGAGDRLPQCAAAHVALRRTLPFQRDAVGPPAAASAD